MPYTVASHRSSAESLLRRYGDATVIDVTSRGPQPWMRFSPFYPQGGIPVPFSPEQTGVSVEGIWQGLKVFVRQDVDPSVTEPRACAMLVTNICFTVRRLRWPPTAISSCSHLRLRRRDPI
jgi:hypothetical protein